ncbi:MAG: hypothetical protein HRT87_12150 [Legionellales bacterium]|nr:hypothetical protein [Legionellales bacterium]
MITPNKSTIYPEKMFYDYYPQKLYRHKNSLAQIRKIIEKNKWSENFIDLEPKLLERKKTELVYFKTDTHWNAVGVLIALSEIYAVIQKNFPEQINETKLKKYIEPLDSELKFILKEHSGDLIYLASQVASPEKLSKYTNKGLSKVSFKYSDISSVTDFDINKYMDGTPISIAGGNIINLKIWIIGDSFSAFLGNSVPNNIFKQVVLIKRDTARNLLRDKQLAELTEKYGAPDIIVDQFVERSIFSQDRIKMAY